MLKFLEKYHVDYSSKCDIFNKEVDLISCNVVSLLSYFGGLSFNRGIYRFHNANSAQIWTKIAIESIPILDGNLYCFGYDWLGRQFAINSHDKFSMDQLVLILDPESGEAYRVERNIFDFHNVELVESPNKAIAEDAFIEWLLTDPRQLEQFECVGLRVPLRLGGIDKLQNRERTDMEVYWEFCSQILNNTKSQPDGTRLYQVRLDDG